MRLPMLKTMQTPATVDDMFNRFLDRDWRFPFFSIMMNEPAVDVYQQDGTVVIKAAMPGAKPEEIQASIEGDVLTLRRTHEEGQEAKGKHYFYQEQASGSFYREVRLPEAVDTDKAEADLKDGMLTIKAPVAAASTRKQIKIAG